MRNLVVTEWPEVPTAGKFRLKCVFLMCFSAEIEPPTGFPTPERCGHWPQRRSRWYWIRLRGQIDSGHNRFGCTADNMCRSLYWWIDGRHKSPRAGHSVAVANNQCPQTNSVSFVDSLCEIWSPQSNQKCLSAANFYGLSIHTVHTIGLYSGQMPKMTCFLPIWPPRWPPIDTKFFL